MIKTSLVGKVGIAGVVGESVRGGFFLVERTPRCKLRICPFWVSSYSGKFLLKFLTVMRVHVR